MAPRVFSRPWVFVGTWLSRLLLQVCSSPYKKVSSDRVCAVGFLSLVVGRSCAFS